MTKTPIEQLGKLTSLKKNLFVGLLPTDAEAVIVSYESENQGSLQVSCSIPPSSHDIHVNFIKYDDWDDYDSKDEEKGLKTLRHRAPRTLMSICYYDFPQPGISSAKEVFIYALDGKNKSKLLGIPLLLPNVYADGKICFGSVGTPRDLRSAYSLFWSTPFNDNLDGDGDGAASNYDYIKRFKSLVLEHEIYKDITDEICGDKFWSIPKVADGILITNSQELLKLIPEKYWMRRREQGIVTPFIIASAESKDDVWSFTGKGFSFEIDKKLIATAQSGNRKITLAQKKFETATKKAEKAEKSKTKVEAQT